MSAASRDLGTIGRGRALALLALFVVPSIGQTVQLSAVPLAAFNLLGSARAVTELYVAAGVFAVAGRFMVPHLVQRFGRLAVLNLGAGSLIAGSALLSQNRLGTLLPGLVLVGFGFACIEITSQLYLLDIIPRQMMNRFEPMRIFASAGPWTLGPWLGVYLQAHVAFAAPFVVTACAALGLLILAWTLRFDRTRGAAALVRSAGPTNPVFILRRFFGQPRLRLAWTLAASRGAWWNMFYVYTPIYAVTIGLGAEAGGAIASIGTAWVWIVPFWGWVGRKVGLRALLLGGYTAVGVLTLLVALCFSTPTLGAAMLIAAALAATIIDGAGNLLFLRAVHSHERPAMTTAFMSFRDASQLGPPAVCTVLLALFALPSVFVAAGTLMLGSAMLARQIHPRM